MRDVFKDYVFLIIMFQFFWLFFWVLRFFWKSDKRSCEWRTFCDFYGLGPENWWVFFEGDIGQKCWCLNFGFLAYQMVQFMNLANVISVILSILNNFLTLHRCGQNINFVKYLGFYCDNQREVKWNEYLLLYSPIQ